MKTDNYRKNCLMKLKTTKNNQNQEAAGQKAGRSLKGGFQLLDLIITA